jgi:hypothetical protein
MTTANFELTIRLSVDAGVADAAKSLILSPPSRESRSRDGSTYLFYIEVVGEEGGDFSLSLQKASSIIDANLRSLVEFESVTSELWCLIFANTEFTGLALAAPTMRQLGEMGTALYISIYGETESHRAL